MPSPSEKYSVFATGVTGLPSPFQPGDILVVTRAGVSYKIQPQDLSYPSYSYQQPVDGATLTATAGLGAFRVDPATAIAALTVVLPPSPLDAQVFSTSTTQDIAALTVTAPGGASVVGSGFTLAALGAFAWQYRAINTTWYPA